MSLSEDPDSLPFQRSSIAAIGSRRRWRLFGRDGDPGAAADAGADDGPVARSMLGSLASRSEPEPEVKTVTRSMLSLESDGTAPGTEELALTPLVSHSTLAELAGLEEHESGAFPVERAILISIAFHVLLVVLLVALPARVPGGGQGDLFAALLQPQPRDDSPIPIVFHDLPGPSRQNPKRSPLSDAERRAGGGDPSRPKADTPYVAPSRGIAGLQPGPRAPRLPGGDAAARQGAAGEAEKQAAAPESASDQKPSEFPSSTRPQSSGPVEMTRLAGLDRAIQEAARGAVGGEGGAPPPNPEGGFVDSGPISFDTTWYDWGPYAAEMVRRIKLHWDIPELARLGWKGSLTVRFYILADGRVADAKILRSSGIPPFDFAAFQAVTRSSPFRPLPAELHEEREGVTVTFFYNMRPSSGEAP